MPGRPGRAIIGPEASSRHLDNRRSWGRPSPHPRRRDRGEAGCRGRGGGVPLPSPEHGRGEGNGEGRGPPRSGTTPTTYRYTGQRWEAGLGLYFYRARWYDPALGRFTQPDTVLPDPGDPQQLNRFSYTRNNPVLYRDPGGHRLIAGYTEEGPGWGPRVCSVRGGEYEHVMGNIGALFDTVLSVVSEAGDWLITGRDLLLKGDFDPLALVGLLPLVPATVARRADDVADLVRQADNATDIARSAGQKHHMLTSKIIDALERHETLRGLFSRNDFVTRAADFPSHQGYQTWHRLYDNEVVKWLADPAHAYATREEFLSFLYELYSRPDMLERFPDALKLLEDAQEVVP